MTVLELGCARRNCCERQPAEGARDPEAIGERVAKEVVEAHTEFLMTLGTASIGEGATALGAAITEALRAAAPGVGFRLVVHGGLGRGCITATRRVGACEPTEQLDTISVAVSVGLCVVAGPRRTWFIHSPAGQSAVRP